MTKAKQSSQTLATNRKARHDYLILETLEAGLELCGTEVKSVKNSSVSLAGAFVKVERGEAWLVNLQIPPYEHGNRFNHDPVRPRRVLLHAREIGYLQVQVEKKGNAIVPLRLYLKRGWVKIALGVCRGKTHGDKRATIRERTAEREAARAVARVYR